MAALLMDSRFVAVVRKPAKARIPNEFFVFDRLWSRSATHWRIDLGVIHDEGVPPRDRGAVRRTGPAGGATRLRNRRTAGAQQPARQRRGLEPAARLVVQQHQCIDQRERAGRVPRAGRARRQRSGPVAPRCLARCARRRRTRLRRRHRRLDRQRSVLERRGRYRIHDLKHRRRQQPVPVRRDRRRRRRGEHAARDPQLLPVAVRERERRHRLPGELLQRPRLRGTARRLDDDLRRRRGGRAGQPVYLSLHAFVQRDGHDRGEGRDLGRPVHGRRDPRVRERRDVAGPAEEPGDRRGIGIRSSTTASRSPTTARSR